MTPGGRARFGTDGQRDAAGAIVAVATALVDDDLEALARPDVFSELADHLEVPDVLVAAGHIVAKLADDRHTVFRIPVGQTIALLGLWVASDELTS